MVSTVDQVVGAGDSIRGQIVPLGPGKIQAPKNIIQTVSGARAVYYKYRSEHLKRIDLYSKIEGLLAGNPPYNPLDLEKHKLSHIANFNNLDGRSLYERGALAYWNLLNQAQYLIKFELRGKFGEDQQRLEWENILARHWDKVVREWSSFYTQFNTLTGQLIKFGISPIVWPDERDWRWRTIELQRFFVTDQAQSDIDLLTAVCVETPFTVQYLWEVYEEFKDKSDKDSPWDMKELAALLIYRANTFAKTDSQILDMMDLQRRLQNGDLSYDALFADTVRIVSLLYKEYNGKISHFMFDRTFDQGQFLFKQQDQYSEMQEAIVIFTASPGEFTIHSNRGLGHKIFSGCQAMMQLDCSIVDCARWSSTPLLKNLATGSKDFEAIRFYPGVPTSIGTAEFQQNNLGANIDQLIGASQYILGKLQYNTANSGDDPGVPDRNVGSVSPSQARMESFKEFGVLKHNIAWFYSQADIVWRNMTAKMLHSQKGWPGYDYARYWKDCCIQDGVPEEIFATGSTKAHKLPRQIYCHATRVAGDGSTLALIMGLQELAPVVSSFSAKGVKEYQRQMVMATMGPAYTEAFIGSDEPDESAGGASLAGVENAIMQASHSPIFSPDNQHRAHIAVHFALAKQTTQQISQQQMDAVDADKVFSVLVPHLGEHIQFIAQSVYEKQFLNSIKDEWGQLQREAALNRANAGKEMEARIKKQQEQEQAAQAQMSDEALKARKLQSDISLNETKVQAHIDNARSANEKRGEVMTEKAHLDAANTRLKVQLEAKAKEKNSLETPPPTDVANQPVSTVRSELSGINGQSLAPFDIEAPTQ